MLGQQGKTLEGRCGLLYEITNQVPCSFALLKLKPPHSALCKTGLRVLDPGVSTGRGHGDILPSGEGPPLRKFSSFIEEPS